MVVRHKGAKRSPETAPGPLKLKEGADALLYLGSRDTLTEVSMTHGDLDGTPYGKEVLRRLTIEGLPSDFGEGPQRAEAPQFPPPQTSNDSEQPPPPLPPPPKNAGAPLPPRPPSQ